MSEPEKGDKVSWNWGSGAPGGTVAEKKTSGEVSVTSKRGNKITKKADPNNPAVAIERSGNNVVKRASELNVEKKGSSGKSAGDKRKKDDEEDEEKGEAMVENEDGKEVRPGGKKAKKEDEKKDERVNGEKKDERVNGEKKGRGRPKGTGVKKEKKPAKPRETGTVSARTRSQNK